MPNTASARDAPSDAAAHHQLSAMIDAGRAFSGDERNVCFLNTRDGRFADVSAGSGLDFPDDGRAVAVTDWDGDGDLDLWISNRNAPRLRLMLNRGGTGHGHVSLRLVGDGATTGRDAVGARAEMQLGGARIVRTVRAGEGFLSQSSKWLHFGLGESDAPEEVVVTWPGGARERFTGFATGRRHRLVQGTGAAELLPARAPVTLAPAPQTAATATGAARVPAITLLPAPRINFKREDGSDTGIGGGRFMLVNLWATWCAPCRAELEAFKTRAADLRAAGVDVAALSVDGLADGGRGGVDPGKMLDEMGFPFAATAATAPLVGVFQALHNELVGLNAPLPVPTSFLIDPTGRLAVMYKGAVSVDQVIADRAHAADTLAGRLRRAAPLGGSTIDHPDAWRPIARQEAMLHVRQGIARNTVGDPAGAAYHFSSAQELDPESAAAAKGLAQIHLRGGELEKAAGQLVTAVRAAPADIDSQYTLAHLHTRLGRPAEAKLCFRALLRAQPDHVPGRNDLAWLLATHHDPAQREPAEAIRIATALDTATGGKTPNILDTLAAAQAADGQFDAAVETCGRAIELAKPEARAALEARLALYKKREPFVEPQPTP